MKKLVLTRDEMLDRIRAKLRLHKLKLKHLPATEEYLPEFVIIGEFGNEGDRYLDVPNEIEEMAFWYGVIGHDEEWVEVAQPVN